MKRRTFKLTNTGVIFADCPDCAGDGYVRKSEINPSKHEFDVLKKFIEGQND